MNIFEIDTGGRGQTHCAHSHPGAAVRAPDLRDRLAHPGQSRGSTWNSRRPEARPSLDSLVLLVPGVKPPFTQRPKFFLGQLAVLILIAFSTRTGSTYQVQYKNT